MLLVVSPVPHVPTRSLKWIFVIQLLQFFWSTL